MRLKSNIEVISFTHRMVHKGFWYGLIIWIKYSFILIISLDWNAINIPIEELSGLRMNMCCTDDWFKMSTRCWRSGPFVISSQRFIREDSASVVRLSGTEGSGCEWDPDPRLIKDELNRGKSLHKTWLPQTVVRMGVGMYPGIRNKKVNLIWVARRRQAKLVAWRILAAMEAEETSGNGRKVDPGRYGSGGDAWKSGSLPFS